MFKTFIDKIFVPQLPKMDANCQTEWNKFSNIISGDSINFGEVQLYLNTLSSTSTQNIQGSQSIPNNFFDKTRNKSPFNLNKVRKESTNENSVAFNPSKTFGGERARLMMQK